MIVLQDINLHFGGFRLKDINLHVRKGEYFVIVGPTGSGKSSVLNCIAGHYAFDSGDLRVDGRPSNHLAVEERDIGYVFQAGLLFPHLNVRQNIAFGLKLRNRPHDRKGLDGRIREICELFSIAPLLDRSVHNLSGGEKQRVALARSMICGPKAMLLDEPFSSVDRNTAENLMIQFKKIQEETSQTVVHVTHNQEEAMILADRICVIDRGVIIQTGTPREILTRPRSPFVAGFFGARNIFRGTAAPDGSGSRIEHDSTVIRAAGMHSGEVVFSVRPEDAVISRNGDGADAGNRFPGTVTQIVDRGILMEVAVDIGFPMVSYSLRKTVTEIGINVGDRINLSFKADAVHIIEHELSRRQCNENGHVL
ncbi:MAG: ABC transporter ATP-binding protein [Desulfobacteraceae bacterium]